MVLLLLGLLLAVVALPVSGEKDSVSEFGGFSQEESQEDAVSKTELEKKLEELLSGVEGVGKTEVLLMTGEEKDSTGFRLTNSTNVTGVLIAAQGADDLTAVQNIKEAVMALFQLEAHKIKVMKMK